MTQFLFSNNDLTTLAFPITNAAVTATLSSGALFPAPGAGQQFSITFLSASDVSIREIVYCTARSGDVVTIVRAREGTTALAWNAGDLAQALLTAGQMQAMMQFSTAAGGVLSGTYPNPGMAAGAASSNYVQRGFSVFIGPASGNFTVPAFVHFIKERLWAAGGGAGGAANILGAGGGGGGGGYCEALRNVSPGDVLAYAIGAGGSGGFGAGNGTAGGNSTFDGMTAQAGQGGAAGDGTGGIGGNGGGASGGTLNISGSPGGPGGGLIGGGLIGGAQGASWCASGYPGGTAVLNGAAGAFFGVGGQGTVTQNSGETVTGGNGGGGLLIIEW